MINPLDYLPFARQLIDNSNRDDEISLRTAIGRAYYAVYLYAGSKYLQAKNNAPEIGSIIKSHARFIKELKRDQNVLFNTIGNQLFNLKGYRETADYNINDEVKRRMAEASYKQALRIKDNLDSI